MGRCAIVNTLSDLLIPETWMRVECLLGGHDCTAQLAGWDPDHSWRLIRTPANEPVYESVARLGSAHAGVSLFLTRLQIFLAVVHYGVAIVVYSDPGQFGVTPINGQGPNLDPGARSAAHRKCPGNARTG